MSRNPYIASNQEPTLRKSVFVFMDILGYSDLILQATTDKSEQATLRDLHATLSDTRMGLEDKDLPPDVQELGDQDIFALKAFTDNIIIGWPVNSDAEIELGSAFMRLATFQLKMAIKGYFVRGAISVGQAYIDDIAVFGGALGEAYEGESRLARDPRIILTKTAVDTAKQHIKYYSDPFDAPHISDILKDADGQWFLNYLNSILIAEDEHGPFYRELLQHKASVERNLLKHAKNPAVWVKYAWVAGYHNYFCDKHPRYFCDEHKIDVELFKAKPTLII